MTTPVELCLRLYRALARSFPHEFQMLYGQDLERLGEDAAPEIWRRHGSGGLLRLIADIALRLPAEYLSEIRGDVRYALRMLVKSPGFTAVGIISLALGIGVCSLFFSEFNAVLFHPLVGVSNPGTLAALDTLVPYPYFERYRDQPGVSVAAFAGPVPFSVAAEGSKVAKSERVSGDLVSPEYFSVLGMKPVLGRLFRADTEKPGTPAVVVVSERFWQTHLHANPDAIGATLRVNGQPATILGVAPKNFFGVWPMTRADLFVPVTSGSSIAPELAGDALQQRDVGVFRVVIRLAHGAKPSAVEAFLDVITRRLDDGKPSPNRDRNGRHVHLLSVNGYVPVPPAERVVVFTFISVLLGLILSLACTNLANLLLARSSERRKEIAIRLSIGAGRFRLLRQLLTESVILSLGGGVVGFVFSYWLASIVWARKFPVPVPLDANFRPDLTVLLLALAVAVLAGIAFGLAPALHITRTDVSTILKEGCVTPLRGYRRFGLRNILVAYQVAGSLTLLLITGFIVLGFGKTARIDPGFDTSNLTLFQLDPIHDGRSQSQIAALYKELPERLSLRPTVRAVTLAEAAPFGEMMAVPNIHFSAPGPRGEVLRNGTRQRIGIKYFATLGIAPVRGREFTDGEFTDMDQQPASGALPALVNQTAAREFFGGDGPLDRTIRDDQHSYTVVGVVPDIKSGFMMAKPVPTVFVPITAGSSHAGPAQQGATLIVRGGAGLDTIADVRNAIASLDPSLTVFNVGTIDERLDQFNSIVQLSATIYLGIGVFGLILASIGLAGVTAYAVARRRKEIGIRMALGAQSSQVLQLVMKEGATLVVVGSALGFVGASLISRTLSSFSSELAEVLGSSARNPLLLIGAPLLLATLAMLACYLPARRLARIDPLAALRDE
jgi:macrolide transport system ATP-binding/permease protein